MLVAASPMFAASPVGLAITAHDWGAAMQLAGSDPLARVLVDYLRLRNVADASPGDLLAFARAHPDWPGQSVLRASRARAIAAEPDDAAALAACDAELPVQDAALLRCAAAARATRPGVAAGWARRAWRDGLDSAAASAAFLAAWPGVASAEDEWQRFDRLAWMGAAQAAAQVVRLDAAHLALGRARLALRAGTADAEQLLRDVPAAQAQSPTLVLERARFLRARGQLAEALAYWRSDAAAAEPKAPPARHPAFWQERERLARLLLDQADAAGAQFLADDANAGADDAPDADFLAGWIALRRLHDPAAARAAFTRLQAASPAVITQARAAFWLGEAAARPADATAAWQRAAMFPTTFYGQRAAARLHRDDPAAPDLPARLAAARDPAPAGQDAFSGTELVRAAHLLAAWDQPALARAFYLAAAAHDPTGRLYALAAQDAARLGLTDTAVIAVRLAGKAGLALPQTGWPVPAFLAGANPVVLGLARQESNFDPGAVSASGAVGLMQLLPGTALDMQRRAHLPGTPKLTDPVQNIRLGTLYFSQILAGFGGRLPLAIAAYNAGPHRVQQWLAASPAPADEASDAMLDWIEAIPFAETRNYVERVLENTAIYAARGGAK